MFKLRR